MKFKVTKKIFQKFPKAKFGALLIEGINNESEVPEIDKLLKQTIDETVLKYKGTNINELSEIRNWREVFSQLGLNRDFLPSNQALLSRTLSKKELPKINPMVDIYNIISLKHLIPIGGHDTNKTQVIRIDVTTGKESFQIMNSDEIESVEKGEFAYLSDNKILTRHFVWRQSETSKTDKNTKKVFIPIDNATGNMSVEEIENIANNLVDLVTKYLGGKAKFTVIDINNPEVNFSNIKTMNVKEKNINISKNMKVNTDPKEIEEFITRGTVDVITKEELKKKMSSGKRLRAYIGYDVTGPDLHIGHGSTLIKLLHWQELGHQVILVIGDDTSRIGDHSDKLEKRKRLTNKEIDFNKNQFREQFGKIIDLDKAEVRYNSEWLDNLKFRDVVELASLFSVQQMIERENFQKRLKAKKTIGLEEILYPLMQGYDSVALKVDLEMGATDQRFNLLAGRKIMGAFGMVPQCVITMPFVTGTDGRKMSKSLNNFIPMRASSNDLFGGIMSVVDDVIIEYFERLTRIPLSEIREMEKELKSEKIHPMELKKRLAFEVTKIYYDEKEAQKAQEHFEKTVQRGELPDKIDEVTIIGDKAVHIWSGEESSVLNVVRSLVRSKDRKLMIPSSSEAKRLIQQGAVEIDGKRITDINKKVRIKPGSIVKIGKRLIVKVNKKD